MCGYVPRAWEDRAHPLSLFGASGRPLDSHSLWCRND